jgi:hypothetical protein
MKLLVNGAGFSKPKSTFVGVEVFSSSGDGESASAFASLTWERDAPLRVGRPCLPRNPNRQTLSTALYTHDATKMGDNKTTEYVTLVSNDGYEFKILRSAACIAGTIKRALDPQCSSCL